MWKILLAASLIAFAAHAEKSAQSEADGDEGQDAEECATASGNPLSVEECRKAIGQKVAAAESCLSDITVKNYEKSAVRAVKFVEEQAKGPASSEGRNFRVVKTALQQSGLIKEKPEVAGGRGALMSANGFVNLMNCPDWAKKLKNSKSIPLGAVLIYESPDKSNPGDIRMKTPRGCMSSAAPLTSEELRQVDGDRDRIKETILILEKKAGEEHVKKASCLDVPGYKLTGIYVKNVN